MVKEKMNDKKSKIFHSTDDFSKKLVEKVEIKEFKPGILDLTIAGYSETITDDGKFRNGACSSLVITENQLNQLEQAINKFREDKKKKQIDVLIPDKQFEDEWNEL